MHFTHENKAISSEMEILVRKQVEKMKKTFDVKTLAEENFSENSPRRRRRKKEEKKQVEEDFTIEIVSDGEGKSVIVIDWYAWWYIFSLFSLFYEKIEKTEKIIQKKYRPGVFLSLTMCDGNCNPK